MNKYKKLQATLKALASPMIGVTTISQLRLIVELGKRGQFSSKEIKSESDNKHHLYNKLKNKGMFTMVSSRGKTRPAIYELSQKGLEVYNVIRRKGNSDEVDRTLGMIHNEGLNRFNPCILLTKLGDFGEYTRRDMLDDVDFKNEPFIRRAGLTHEVRRSRVIDNNGMIYTKPVYRLTKKGEAILENLTRLV
tara:strand:+ start:4589 stop:5164 length:576 start_codon:yes stop_codon:yes gene_type:complete